jgi:protein SCO1/2
MKGFFIAFLLLLLAPGIASGALPPAALKNVVVDLPPDARLPLNLSAGDISGRALSIADAMGGRSAFVLFADYTCKNLCGPALVLLSAALRESGLSPLRYRLIVIGIDPKDTAADASRMAAAQIPDELRKNAVLLLPDARNLAEMTRALGFHYAYDQSLDQFAHPEVVYAVDADGRVIRLLSPLTLTAKDVRNAFSPAQLQNSLSEDLRVLCYHFAQLSGIHTAAIELLLKIAAVLTLAAMAGGVLLMRKRGNAA